MASDTPNKEKPTDEAGASKKSGESDENEALQSAREKVPEGEGNLRRRADWFQKRTGGTG